MTTSVSLQLSEVEADPDRLDTLTRHLGEELRGLDVRDVRRPDDRAAPAGARGLDSFSVGGLLLTLATPEALGAVVAALRAWVARAHGGRREVRLEIGGDVLSLTAATGAEQERLVELFVSRHSTPGSATWPDVAEP